MGKKYWCQAPGWEIKNQKLKIKMTNQNAKM